MFLRDFPRKWYSSSEESSPSYGLAPFNAQSSKATGNFLMPLNGKIRAIIKPSEHSIALPPL